MYPTKQTNPKDLIEKQMFKNETALPNTAIVFPADTSGCGWYRIQKPYAFYRHHSGKNIMQMNNYPSASFVDNRVKAFVFQRQWLPEQVQVFKSLKLHYPNTKIIYELDDLIYKLPASNPVIKHITGEHIKAFRSIIKSADHITVSTIPLQNELRTIVSKNTPISVIPNRLNVGYFQPIAERDTSKKLKVMYAGSSTHADDFRFLESLVLKTINEFEWIFFGFCPSSLIGKVKWIETFVAPEHFLKEVSKYKPDVYLAPLKDNDFNISKSNIKLLEAGALGIPCITSDIYTYQENPGYKLKNKTNKWYNALYDLKDETTRLNLAKLTQGLSYQYSFENNIKDIVSTFDNILFK